MAGWWFQLLVIFIPIFGEMIQFDEFFNWVAQPPTSMVISFGKLSLHHIPMYLLKLGSYFRAHRKRKSPDL